MAHLWSRRVIRPLVVLRLLVIVEDGDVVGPNPPPPRYLFAPPPRALCLPASSHLDLRCLPSASACATTNTHPQKVRIQYQPLIGA